MPLERDTEYEIRSGHPDREIVGVLRVFAQHRNQLGDWCPWSGVSSGGMERCPGECPASEPEASDQNNPGPTLSAAYSMEPPGSFVDRHVRATVAAEPLKLGDQIKGGRRQREMKMDDDPMVYMVVGGDGSLFATLDREVRDGHATVMVGANLDIDLYSMPLSRWREVKAKLPQGGRVTDITG